MFLLVLLIIASLCTGARLSTMKKKKPTDADLEAAPKTSPNTAMLADDMATVKQIQKARQTRYPHVDDDDNEKTCLGPITGHCRVCETALNQVLKLTTGDGRVARTSRSDLGFIAIHAEADKEVRLWELREDGQVWTKRSWKKYGFWEETEDEYGRVNFQWRLTPEGTKYHQTNFYKDFKRREEMRCKAAAKEAKWKEDEKKKADFWAGIWGESGEGEVANPVLKKKKKDCIDEDESEENSDEYSSHSTESDYWQDESSDSYRDWDDDSISHELAYLNEETDGLEENYEVQDDWMLEELVAETIKCVPTRSFYSNERSKAERRKRRDTMQKMQDFQRKSLYY